MKRCLVCTSLALLIILLMIPIIAMAADSVQLTIPEEYSLDGKTQYQLTLEEHEELLARVHQYIDDELDSMAIEFRRYVSVDTNDDVSEFTIVIWDAANWCTADEIAEARMCGYSQMYAAYSAKEQDSIHFYYMNMNGDEVYHHCYNRSEVQKTSINNNDFSESDFSNWHLVDNSESSTGNTESSSSFLQDQSTTDNVVSNYDSAENNLSGWHLADNQVAVPTPMPAPTDRYSGYWVYVSNNNVAHLNPNCRHMKYYTEMSWDEAKANGATLCSICFR